MNHFNQYNSWTSETKPETKIERQKIRKINENTT